MAGDCCRVSLPLVLDINVALSAALPWSLLRSVAVTLSSWYAWSCEWRWLNRGVRGWEGIWLCPSKSILKGSAAPEKWEAVVIISEWMSRRSYRFIWNWPPNSGLQCHACCENVALPISDRLWVVNGNSNKCGVGVSAQWGVLCLWVLDQRVNSALQANASGAERVVVLSSPGVWRKAEKERKRLQGKRELQENGKRDNGEGRQSACEKISVTNQALSISTLNIPNLGYLKIPIKLMGSLSPYYP